MFEGDYSKKVWIISIVMALGAIAMDIGLLLGEDGIMKDSVWMTLPLTCRDISLLNSLAASVRRKRKALSSVTETRNLPVSFTPLEAQR